MSSDQDRPDSRSRGPDDEPLVASEPGARAEDHADDDPYDSTHVVARRLFQVAVAVLAVALFLGVVWYAYTWGDGATSETSGELPVVKAEDGPEKVEPEDPGGMDVPHQDTLVMNQEDEGSGSKVERLLPPPETPQPPEGNGTAGGTAGTSQPAASGESGEGDGAAGTDTDSQGDGTAAEGEGIESTQEVAELPETTPDAGGASADDGDSGDGSADDGDAASQPADAQDTPPTPSESPERSAPAETQTARETPAASGRYAVQIAALRDEASARTAWSRLRERYPDLLGGRELLLQPVDIEGKGTFWRVRTGPFAEKAAADALCAKLKAKGQDCLAVTR